MAASLSTLPTGETRGDTWRAHTLVPGRPGLACNGQLRTDAQTLDRAGFLEHPEYIRQSGINPGIESPNVAALAASVSVGLHVQFPGRAAQGRRARLSVTPSFAMAR